ncbi:hypothetical protein ERJ75_000718300 [Trypanosoma vivax]|uniref:Autophagy protein ATG5 UblA domain-containing protein n=1 Tax=Trypanosoma vivax (strain Y486) TaxID=1055687 RepID=G0TWR3_TRYVY|nr:hypothetical protein TRVL_00711 [Trypanosoma vivax]KAH8614054.1 hypothetical protein ERJ75_000718300 [Trypanosoma vivax]CCC48401.1 conserved hypothetical protein [Trypanosoma vivax Y486]
MSLQAEDYLGAVTVIISLSEKDYAANEAPPPLTYMLPRSSVLLAVRDEVQRFFAPFTIPQAGLAPLIWLTHNDEPVPWQYPVGAIKDSINALTIMEYGGSFCSPLGGVLCPAAQYPAVYTTPLRLQARFTCVHADKPPTIPCPGQEDAVPGRSNEQAIREFLKQIIKGTHSAMYGNIKTLMDARSEVINDILNLSMCLSTGEPFVHALRLHRERVAALSRAAGKPQNVVLMINLPFAPNYLHFSVHRVPLMSRCNTVAGESSNLQDCSSSIPPCHRVDLVDGSDTCGSIYDTSVTLPAAYGESKSEPLAKSFGEVLWRAFFYLHRRWCNTVDGNPTDSRCSSFFRAISPFYTGLDDVSCLDGQLTTRMEELMHKFTSAGDAVDTETTLTVQLDKLPGPTRRLCFMLQGVCPPLHTPVGYLIDRFGSADGRLYVTLALL